MNTIKYFLAFLIDYIIIAASTNLILFGLATYAFVAPDKTTAIYIMLISIIMYFMWMFVLSVYLPATVKLLKGQTLGRRILGVQLYYHKDRLWDRFKRDMLLKYIILASFISAVSVTINSTLYATVLTFMVILILMIFKWPKGWNNWLDRFTNCYPYEKIVYTKPKKKKRK